MIIAIDGPAASGKGTLARRLADHYALAYLDTGLIYRAVGKKVLDAGKNLNDTAAFIDAAQHIEAKDLKDPVLRQDEYSIAASHAGKIPEVRKLLLDFQRFAAHHPPADKKGAVLDGRDIGTVVCPEADIKIFVTANLETRAKRRFEELQTRGLETTYTQVLEDLTSRDKRDQERAIAPLKAAENAFQLDTTTLNAEETFKIVTEYVDITQKIS